MIFEINIQSEQYLSIYSCLHNYFFNFAEMKKNTIFIVNSFLPIINTDIYANYKTDYMPL